MPTSNASNTANTAKSSKTSQNMRSVISPATATATSNDLARASNTATTAKTSKTANTATTAKTAQNMNTATLQPPLCIAATATNVAQSHNSLHAQNVDTAMLEIKRTAFCAFRDVGRAALSAKTALALAYKEAVPYVTACTEYSELSAIKIEFFRAFLSIYDPGVFALYKVKNEVKDIEGKWKNPAIKSASYYWNKLLEYCEGKDWTRPNSDTRPLARKPENSEAADNEQSQDKEPSPGQGQGQLSLELRSIIQSVEKVLLNDTISIQSRAIIKLATSFAAFNSEQIDGLAKALNL